jgi:TolA-binding protein
MEDNNDEEEMNSVEELQELLQEKENRIRELEEQLRRKKDNNRTERDSDNENELQVEDGEEDEEDDGDLKDKIGRFLKGLVGRDSAISRMVSIYLPLILFPFSIISTSIKNYARNLSSLLIFLSVGNIKTKTDLMLVK